MLATERALRLDPGFAYQYVHGQGSAYLVAGKYEVAAAAFRERPSDVGNRFVVRPRCLRHALLEVAGQPSDAKNQVTGLRSLGIVANGSVCPVL